MELFYQHIVSNGTFLPPQKKITFSMTIWCGLRPNSLTLENIKNRIKNINCQACIAMIRIEMGNRVDKEQFSVIIKHNS